MTFLFMKIHFWNMWFPIFHRKPFNHSFGLGRFFKIWKIKKWRFIGNLRRGWYLYFDGNLKGNLSTDRSGISVVLSRNISETTIYPRMFARIAKQDVMCPKERKKVKDTRVRKFRKIRRRNRSAHKIRRLQLLWTIWFGITTCLAYRWRHIFISWTLPWELRLLYFVHKIVLHWVLRVDVSHTVHRVENRV